VSDTKIDIEKMNEIKLTNKCGIIERKNNKIDGNERKIEK